MLNSCPVLTVSGKSTVNSPAKTAAVPTGIGTKVTPFTVSTSMVCGSAARSGCTPYIQSASVDHLVRQTPGQ